MPDNEYSVELGLVLNDSSKSAIKEQIKSLGNDKVKIQFDLSNAKNQINTLKKEIQSLGKINFKLNGVGASADLSGVTKGVDATQRAYKDLLKIQQQLNSTRVKISGLDATKDAQQIRALSGQLERLMADYNNLYQSSHKAFSTDQLDELARKSQVTSNQITAINAKIIDSQAQLAKAFNTKVANGGMDAEITSLEQKINALSNSSVGLRQKLTELRSIQASAGNNPSMEQSVSLQQRYNELIAQTNNQLKQEMIAQQELNAKQKQQQAYMKLLNDRSSLSNQMSIWLKNNSAAAKQFGSQIQTLQAELKSCDSTRLTGIKREFKEITQQAAIAGKNVMTMGDQLKKKASTITSYFSGFMAVTYAIQGLRNMYDKVLDINTAMTELKKVTDDTNATYSQFLDNAAEEAGSVSATISDYIKTASDYARLGYNINQASDLAKSALLYNNVGDEIENVDEATSSLISTMKGFHIEAEDSINIVDKFNNVGKVYCPVIQ